MKDYNNNHNVNWIFGSKLKWFWRVLFVVIIICIVVDRIL